MLREGHVAGRGAGHNPAKRAADQPERAPRRAIRNLQNTRHKPRNLSTLSPPTHTLHASSSGQSALLGLQLPRPPPPPSPRPQPPRPTGSPHPAMGAAPSHEDAHPQNPPQPSRPTLGPRTSNPRHLAAPAPGDAAALPAAFFRDTARIPRDHRPVEYRPPVQQTSVVRNVVNLAKQSLTLVQHDTNPSVYLVDFEFDADVEGYITIYYCAEEIIQRVRGRRGPTAPVQKVSYKGKADGLPGRTKFGAGRGQRYRQKPEKGLDVRKYRPQDLTYKPDSNRYPVIIRLEAVYPPDSQVDHDLRVKSQTTFATIEELNGRHTIHVVAQQVLVGGTIYRVQDLYGIGAADVTASKEPEAPDQDDSYSMDMAHECVICLTEPCNSAVLPCNHLCLCDDCARILCTETDYERRKCPVCRTQVVSLLRIISPSTNDQSEASNGADAGSTMPDNFTAAATVSRTDSDLPVENQPARSIEVLEQDGDCEPHVAINLRTGLENAPEGNTITTPSTIV